MEISSRQMQENLNVVTYNVLGLKYISHHRVERLVEIGRQIASLSPAPHIVCLQECWVENDYLSIRRFTDAILPYGKLFYSGFFGAGLAILSRWPIEESCMYPFPLNGRPTGVLRGDWYVGKGVGWARIRIPDSFFDGPMSSPRIYSRKETNAEVPSLNSSTVGEEYSQTQPLQPTSSVYVSVYTTHLHAPYHSIDDHPNAYLSHRIFQSWFFSTLLRSSVSSGDLVLATGDFNSLALSLPHRIITSRGGVHDIWRMLYPDSSLGPVSDARESARGRAVPSALFNKKENGATSDSVYNTWRWTSQEQKQQYKLGYGHSAISQRRHIPDNTPDPQGKRLDYIFFGHRNVDGPGKDHNSSVSPQIRWKIESCEVGMTELHPDIHCSLSDHFSVHASFSCSFSSSADVADATTSNGHQETNANSIMLKTGQQLGANNSKIHSKLKNELPESTKLTGSELQQIQTQITQERTHIQRLRFRHLSASLICICIIFPACAVGIWFIPSSTSPPSSTNSNNHNTKKIHYTHGLSFLLLVLSTLAFGIGIIGALIGGLWCWGEDRMWMGFEEDIKLAMLCTNTSASPTIDTSTSGNNGSSSTTTKQDSRQAHHDSI